MTLEQWAIKYVQALQKEQFDTLLDSQSEVLPLLEDSPVFAPRFHAWWAQAFLSKREPKTAVVHCNTAIRLAKNILDQDGVIALKELRSQAIAMLSALSAQRHGQPGIVERALTAIETGDFDTGEALADQAHREAIQEDDPKKEILSLLTLAKLPHRSEKAIEIAYERTQEIGDVNLITAVKKAMDALGHKSPPHIF